MVMDDDTWHLIKHTNKVTGFVGWRQESSGPISKRGDEDRQPDAGRHRQATPQDSLWSASWCGSRKALYRLQWLVEDVNYEKQGAVSVTIFGRATPVELEFDREDVNFVGQTACGKTNPN